MADLLFRAPLTAPARREHEMIEWRSWGETAAHDLPLMNGASLSTESTRRNVGHPPGSAYISLNLSDKELKAVSQYVYDRVGIRLDETKRELIKSRLNTRIRSLRLPSYEAYLEYVEGDRKGAERTFLLDSLTTNLTYFFRESQHFDFVVRNVIEPRKRKASPLRIWSAGCSSGEEPYTLSMLIHEHLGGTLQFRDSDPRILATDISTRMLAKAKAGTYPRDVVQRIPDAYRKRYMEPVKGSPTGEYVVSSELKSMIRFAKLNLMGDWPMHGPFDVIFCRNVMIYFDEPTRETLVARYYGMLREGGHFFVSLAESLTGIRHDFKYLAPGTYQR